MIKNLNSLGVYLMSGGSIAGIEAIDGTVLLDHTKLFLQCGVALITIVYIGNKVLFQWKRNHNERKNDKWTEKKRFINGKS